MDAVETSPNCTIHDGKAVLNTDMPGIAANADKYVTSYPCSDAHKHASRQADIYQPNSFHSMSLCFIHCIAPLKFFSDF